MLKQNAKFRETKMRRKIVLRNFPSSVYNTNNVMNVFSFKVKQKLPGGIMYHLFFT